MCSSLADLDFIGRGEIGREFDGSSRSPSLSLMQGTTSANFHDFAKIIEQKGQVIKFVITGRVTGRSSLRIQAVTLSAPGALFDGRALSIFRVSCSLTCLKWNLVEC